MVRRIRCRSVDETTLLRHLASLPGVDILQTPDATFVYFDPERQRAHDRQHPFVTIVRQDHAAAAGLLRPGDFRLSIGVEPDTYRSLFGALPAWNKSGGAVATGHDFSATDVVLPQPFYAPSGWISINSPTAVNWPRVRAWIDEAYARAARGT